MGNWYAGLPFGDPKRLRSLRTSIENMVAESMEAASRGGHEDLPLQDAALKADNMVGKSKRQFQRYVRWTDHES